MRLFAGCSLLDRTSPNASRDFSCRLLSQPIIVGVGMSSNMVNYLSSFFMCWQLACTRVVNLE